MIWYGVDDIGLHIERDAWWWCWYAGEDDAEGGALDWAGLDGMGIVERIQNPSATTIIHIIKHTRQMWRTWANDVHACGNGTTNEGVYQFNKMVNKYTQYMRARTNNPKKWWRGMWALAMMGKQSNNHRLIMANDLHIHMHMGIVLWNEGDSGMDNGWHGRNSGRSQMIGWQNDGYNGSDIGYGVWMACWGDGYNDNHWTDSLCDES